MGLDLTRRFDDHRSGPRGTERTREYPTVPDLTHRRNGHCNHLCATGMCDRDVASAECVAGEMQPRCSRDAAEIQPRCSRGAAEMQPKCSRGVACGLAEA